MLIKACLNGNRPAGSHPRLPVSSAELAADAVAARAAGAGAVHVHPRGRDGSESLGAEVCDAAVNAIRAASRGLPIGLSTGAWIEPDLHRRIRAIDAWTARPDFASVNFVEEGAVDVCRLLLDKGIGVEAGLISVDDAELLARSGLGQACLRVLVEVMDSEPAAATARAEEIDAALDATGISAPRLHHGTGLATWAVIEQAIGRGHDIRIGLEDTFQLPDGAPANDNAELVRAAAVMAAGSGTVDGISSR